MKKFGLIGDPVGASLSPALFRAGYGGRYAYDLIEGSDFEASYRRFAEGYDGINVTAPFKLQAFARADKRSDICTRTGAANLLLKTENGIYADNTDYSGIVLSVLEAVLCEDGAELLERCGTDFSPAAGEIRRKYGYRPAALIAGCGGAGRAAALAAAVLGYETVLLNRTAAKAEKIAADMPEYGFRTDTTEKFPAYFRECDLLIYTVPEKIREIDEITASSFPKPGKVILEANYKNPSFGRETVRLAESLGGTYVSGKRWLLFQALAGFRIFTGETPDFQKMSEVL